MLLLRDGVCPSLQSLAITRMNEPPRRIIPSLFRRILCMSSYHLPSLGRHPNTSPYIIHEDCLPPHTHASQVHDRRFGCRLFGSTTLWTSLPMLKRMLHLGTVVRGQILIHHQCCCHRPSRFSTVLCRRALDMQNSLRYSRTAAAMQSQSGRICGTVGVGLASGNSNLEMGELTSQQWHQACDTGHHCCSFPTSWPSGSTCLDRSKLTTPFMSNLAYLARACSSWTSWQQLQNSGQVESRLKGWHNLQICAQTLMTLACTLLFLIQWQWLRIIVEGTTTQPNYQWDHGCSWIGEYAIDITAWLWSRLFPRLQKIITKGLLASREAGAE